MGPRSSSTDTTISTSDLPGRIRTAWPTSSGRFLKRSARGRRKRSPERIHDLGDITGARATEAYLVLWIRLVGQLGTSEFNIHVAR